MGNRFEDWDENQTSYTSEEYEVSFERRSWIQIVVRGLRFQRAL